MDGEQMFEVTEYGDFCCEGVPVYAKVIFTRELRNKIRLLMATSRALKDICMGWQIRTFDDRATWLDLEMKKDDDLRIECVTLDVDRDSFCWRGTVKHTDVKIGFGDTFLGTDEKYNEFFEEGDVTEAEAAEEVCKSLIGLGSDNKFRDAVTLASIKEEVRSG